MPRQPDLIDPLRLPHRAMRTGETYLKRQLFKIEQNAVIRLERLYQDAYVDLRNQANDIAERLGLERIGNDGQSALWRTTFMSYTRTRLMALRDAIVTETSMATSTALAGGYFGRLWLLDMATRADVHIQMPVLRMSDLRKTLLREDVYSDMIFNLLGEAWRDQYGLELDALLLQIRRSIGSGLVEGEGIAPIMNRIANEMGITIDRRRGGYTVGPRGGRTPSVLNREYRRNFARVQAIARTVINSMSNAGAINAYRANQDILAGYQWLTAKDERVCLTCRGLDGTVYAFNSVKQPPAHPNCRCTVIPVLKPEMLEDPKAATRVNFDAWARGFGIERELAAFLVPAA